jgi:RNA polymerase sigma factor (sigma-70 family)
MPEGVVSTPGRLEEWAGRALRERVAVGAVFLELRNRGLHPSRAGDLAEEAVQQGLAQAARLADLEGRFTSFDHFCNWLRVVAINHVRSLLRRKQARQLAPGALEALAQPAEDGAARAAALRDLLELLPPEDRRLVLLRYEEGLTLDELVERLLASDPRSKNARRLDIWHRVQDILGWLRQRLQDGGPGAFPPGA